MDKYAVAQILREIGLIIELVDENPSKGFAYRRASRAIEFEKNFDKRLRERSLESIPGIGKKTAGMIQVLVKKGYLPYHQELLQRIPYSLLELLFIPGLGTKRIRFLYENYNIKNIDELKALLENETLKIKGFGPSYIKKILNQISKISVQGVSLLYPQALNIARAFLEILNKKTEKLEITGDLRRKLEIITQIDLVGTSKNPEMAFAIFTKHPLVKKVIQQNSTGISVLLKHGIKARLDVCKLKEFPVLLLTSTGNKAHIEKLRQQALQTGYFLKETSFSSLDKPLPEINREEDIYHYLRLPFIPPELREGYGEIEEFKKRKLELVQENDLKGAFHCHTQDSDGIRTVKEMAVAAKRLGWSYIGISDHSQSSYFANGMSQEKLLQQRDHIRQLNQLDDQFYIFSGIECDILKDGMLDFSNDILKELDFVIASVHSHFKQEKDIMTKRIIRAIENPYTTIIGHLTGRLLRHRDPYQLDIQKVIDACIANNKVIELNASPSRLDMDWRLWIKAKEKGLKCCISPDAHSIDELMYCQYGVNMARKGWLEKDDVINTFSLKKMKKYLKSNH